MKFLYPPSACCPHSSLIPSLRADPNSSNPTPPSRIDIDVNVPDLNLKQTSLVVLVNIDVDWEMCVDVSHLVLEALGDTDDQVVDEGSDGSEGSNVLSRAVVEFDVDDILLGVREVDRQVVQVLRELA